MFALGIQRQRRSIHIKSTDTYSAVQLKVGVVILGVEDTTLVAFPVHFVIPVVQDNCEDTRVDGPDPGSKDFERDDTRLLVEFEVLTNDCEDTELGGRHGMEEAAERDDTEVDKDMKDEAVEGNFRRACNDEVEYEVESPPVLDEDDNDAVASVDLFGCPV